MWAVTGCSAVSNGADGSTVSDWNEGGGKGDKGGSIDGFKRCETKRYLKKYKVSGGESPG